MIWLLVKAIFAVALIIIFMRFVKGKKYERIITLIALVGYMGVIVYFTIIRGSRKGLGGIKIRLPLPFYRAIISGRYGLTTNRSMLNVLLFVPYGYILIQMLSLQYNYNDKKVKVIVPKWWFVTGWGFLSSLLIETCQFFFRVGVFELDDIVKNTIGAVIGSLLYRLLNGGWKTKMFKFSR